MVRCVLFIPTESGCTKACTNCIRWNGKNCKDERRLQDMYEESEDFAVYDQMMRDNKGIYIK